MSTRRVTRSATAALKELEKNAAAADSFVDRHTEVAETVNEPLTGENQAASTKAKSASKKRAATTEMESAPKRKKATLPAAKPTEAVKAKPVKAAKKTKVIAKRGWTLPHGMGLALSTAEHTETVSGGAEALPSSTSAVGPVEATEANLTQMDQDNDVPLPDIDDTSLSTATIEPAAAQLDTFETPKRLTRGSVKKIVIVNSGGKSSNNDKAKTVDIDIKIDKSLADYRMRTKRGTTNKYGLTRGYSPYPNRTVPTPEQCEDVHRILVETHGAVTQPEKAGPPSITVAGCGEVPAVLDALCRTIISGNTLMAHADKAVEKLAEVYGVKKDGVGAGSIDWDAVWQAPKSKLINAIRVAGCPDRKAGHIKATLDMVREEQKARAHAHIEGALVPGAQNEDDHHKAVEVQKVVENYLSLEHVRDMTADEALTEFLRYPGIGVKTAACVMLFTLRFPCFAVDTHVHKFCKWLGWVPEKANDVDTFNHGEHMVPDHLKYALHQLFIRHGQDCFKCRKATKPGSDGWNEAPDCPLEHLLDRNKAAAEDEEDADAEEEQATEGGSDADYGTTKEKKPKRARGKKKGNTAKAKADTDDQEEDATEDEDQAENSTVESEKKPKRSKGKQGSTSKAQAGSNTTEAENKPKRGKAKKKVNTTKVTAEADDQVEHAAGDEGQAENSTVDAENRPKGGKGKKGGTSKAQADSTTIEAETPKRGQGKKGATLKANTGEPADSSTIEAETKPKRGNGKKKGSTQKANAGVDAQVERAVEDEGQAGNGTIGAETKPKRGKGKKNAKALKVED